MGFGFNYTAWREAQMEKMLSIPEIAETVENVREEYYKAYEEWYREVYRKLEEEGHDV